MRVDAQICVLDFWSLASHVRDAVLYVYVLRPAASMVHKVRKFGTGRCNSSKHCLELMNRNSPCIHIRTPPGRSVRTELYPTTVPAPAPVPVPGPVPVPVDRWSRSPAPRRSGYRAVYRTRARPAISVAPAARRWYPYCTSRVRYPIATLEIADRVSYRTTGQSLCLARDPSRCRVAVGRGRSVGRRARSGAAGATFLASSDSKDASHDENRTRTERI